jgi:hypothetical protein
LSALQKSAFQQREGQLQWSGSDHKSPGEMCMDLPVHLSQEAFPGIWGTDTSPRQTGVPLWVKKPGDLEKGAGRSVRHCSVRTRKESTALHLLTHFCFWQWWAMPLRCIAKIHPHSQGKIARQTLPWSTSLWMPSASLFSTPWTHSWPWKSTVLVFLYIHRNESSKPAVLVHTCKLRRMKQEEQRSRPAWATQ